MALSTIMAYRAVLIGALVLIANAAPTPGQACTGKLGVSRTISLDTSGGPLYGSLQYKTESFLKDGEVVLTFDDGPLRSKTRRILAALKDHCTKATFFMVGRMAVADPAMVREVARYGHTIATHTWSHRNLQRRSTPRGRGEFELGISAVEHTLGKPVAPFFRFPYLADSKAMIAYSRQRNVAVFSIDVDSYDYRTRRGDSVHRAVMRQLTARKKGIMLFHDIQISTVRGLPSVLDTLHRKGYKVVHIVAKGSVATVPAYDAQARELHAKRRYSPSIRPVGSGRAASPARKTTVGAGRRRAIGQQGRTPKLARAAKTRAARAADNWKLQVLGQP